MDRLYNGMKRSSSESATNATREPETMFSNVAPESVQPKPWKQRFSFRQPRKQQPIEEVCWSHSLTMSCQNVITAVSVSINVNQFTRWDVLSLEIPIIGRYSAFNTNHWLKIDKPFGFIFPVSQLRYLTNPIEQYLKVIVIWKDPTWQWHARKLHNLVLKTKNYYQFERPVMTDERRGDICTLPSL